MSYKWLFTGVLLVAFSSVSASNPAEGVNDDPSARLRFAMDPFEIPISYSWSRGDAKDQILQRFGKPTENSVSTRETRFVGEVQTSFRFKFADIQFVVGQMNDRPNTWIEQIEIVGNTHVLKNGVQIGTSRAQIVSLFAPIEHYAAMNPMRVSVPTLETQSDFARTGGAITGHYVPTMDITFEFDEQDCLSRIIILTAGAD